MRLKKPRLHGRLQERQLYLRMHEGERNVAVHRGGEPAEAEAEEGGVVAVGEGVGGAVER